MLSYVDGILLMTLMRYFKSENGKNKTKDLMIKMKFFKSFACLIIFSVGTVRGMDPAEYGDYSSERTSEGSNPLNALFRTIISLIPDDSASREKQTLAQEIFGILSKGDVDQVRGHLRRWRSICINAKDSKGYSPLHRTCAAGNDAMVELLIERGAVLNERTPETGRTPLIIAIAARHRYTAELLLNYNAEVFHKDKDGRTALHYAAEAEDTGLVKLLLEHGADATVKDHNKKLPVDLAGEDETSITLLRNAMREQNARSWFSKPQVTDETLFISAACNGNLATIRRLLDEKKVDVNFQDVVRNTALHYAAREAREEVVRHLIEQGAFIHGQNRAEMTALHYATRGGHRAIVRLLIEHGANAGVLDKWLETPFEAAGIHQSEIETYGEIIRLLAYHGAYIESAVQTLFRGQPLHLMIGVHKRYNAGDSYPEHFISDVIQHLPASHEQKILYEALLFAVSQRYEKGVQMIITALDAKQLVLREPLCKALILSVRCGNMNALRIIGDFLIKHRQFTQETCAHLLGLIKTCLHRALHETNQLLSESEIDYELVKLFILSRSARDNYFSFLPLDLLQDVLRRVKMNQIPPLSAVATPVRVVQRVSRLPKLTIKNPLIKSIREYGNYDLTQGGDVNEKDGNGDSPLHIAAARGWLRLIPSLIRDGASIFALNNQGLTPCHILLNAYPQGPHAINRGESNVFVQYGDLSHRDDEGSTFLQRVVGTHSKNQDALIRLIAEILRKNGTIDIKTILNAHDNEGRTPLHYAFKAGNHDVIIYLVHKGADINAQDHTGESSIACALRSGDRVAADNMLNADRLWDILYSRVFHRDL